MAFCVLVAASASAQLPSVEAFLAEPLHTVRGRLLAPMASDPDPRLGVELTMPTSIAAGSFASPRDRFERHPIMLPGVRFAWPYGEAIESHLHRHERSDYGAPPREERGEGWLSLIEDTSVQVVVRLTTPLGPLDCVGSGGSEVTDGQVSAVRDWLLARCRSARVVPVP